MAMNGGDTENVVEVVCDMSPAFLSGVTEHLPSVPKAEVTVDRFHIVETFTKRLDEVRKEEPHCGCLCDLTTTIKGKLRWIHKAPTPRVARWRITNYLKVMQAAVSGMPLLKPMGKALATLERHADTVFRRWHSGLTNARLEGMNGLFQATRSRASGYRSEANFVAMIFLIGSPVGRFLDQAKSTRSDEGPLKSDEQAP